MGDEPMASVPLNAGGCASYTFSNLQHGDWSFYAVYPIQGPFASSTSPTILVAVQQIPTTTSLTASANSALSDQSVTLTATVQSTSLTPPGSVILYGVPGLGAANLNSSGVATITSELPVGTDSITADYVSADGNFAQSSSQPVTIKVSAPPPDSSITDSPGTLTIMAGPSGNTSLTITPVGGYTANIALGCSGLPSGATCSFSPSALSPTGDNNNLATTLTVTVAAATGGIQMKLGPFPQLGGGVFVAAWCMVVSVILLASLRNCGRRWKRRLVEAVLGVVCATALVSCGGGSSGLDGG
jgi:hypothetical protein